MNLLAWRDGAALGDRIVYHTGFLGRDRLRPANAPSTVDIDRRASDAWDLYLKGKVRLYQHRLGKNSFEYIAEASADPPNKDYTEYAKDRNLIPA